MKQMEEWASRMVDMIDAFADLPNECPEIVKSTLFQKLMQERTQLMKDFNEATEELEQQLPPSKGIKFNN